ncbi:hypothetical protein [Antarctobacter jejuensis]|uniref:hypothetical protein n=1 Tax=Antarctobacter jejuensis TaxID=1439938 RepID=UPI003FD42C1A
MWTKTQTIVLSFLTCLCFALPNASPADTDAQIEQAIAKIRSDIRKTEQQIFAHDVEKGEIHAFQMRMWQEWIQPWQANDRKIRDLQAEVDALKRMGAFNQNSRSLNDQMRALLDERGRLERLDGGTIDDCAPPCTTIKQLFTYYGAREARRKELVAELTRSDGTSKRLYRALEVEKGKLADNHATKLKLFEQERKRLKALRKRYADMLKNPDSFFLPNLDGGMPRVLTRAEFEAEVTVNWFEIGSGGDLDKPEIREEIKALVRKMLQSSKDMRQRISDQIRFLDDQITALDHRLDRTASTLSAETCPPRNPDPAGQVLRHRIPPGDDDTYLACAYFADPAGGQQPGPIKSRVRYEDGKEAGVAAYFDLDGGHHLQEIHNIHAPRQSGAECRYHSASAIAKYRLQGHDGSEMIVFCEADGTVGQCDYITHDGRSRRCSADCTDKCTDLRQKIGWPAMQ